MPIARKGAWDCSSFRAAWFAVVPLRLFVSNKGQVSRLLAINKEKKMKISPPEPPERLWPEHLSFPEGLILMTYKNKEHCHCHQECEDSDPPCSHIPSWRNKPIVMRGNCERKNKGHKKQGARGHSLHNGVLTKDCIFFNGHPFLYKIVKDWGFRLQPSHTLYFQFTDFWNVQRHAPLQLFIRWNHQYLHTGIICETSPTTQRRSQGRPCSQTSDSIDRRTNVIAFSPIPVACDGICTHSRQLLLTGWLLANDR